MSPLVLPAVSMALDYAKRQRQAEEERRAAAADIYASSARSLGAPTYGVSAAKANRRAGMLTQPDRLAMLQSYLQSQGQPQQQQEGMPSWLMPQYRR